MTSRTGFALLYTIFVIVALSVVGLALMAVGTREAMIAGAVERREVATARATSVALDAVADWSTRDRSGIDVGAAVRDVAPNGTRRDVTRLAPTLYLISVEAIDPAPARAALLVRTLDSDAMAAAFPSAVTAEANVEVRAGHIGLAHHGCAGHGPTILAPDVVVRAGAVAMGDPAIALGTAPPPPSPDPFAPPLISTLATARPLPGTVTPSPITGAEGCVAAGRNWGAVDPRHPCYQQLPIIHVAGSVRMSGGEGRGILVVDGDAHLSDSARFHGLVLARDRLLVSEDSRVHGAVRAAKVVVGDGQVRRDVCVLGDVLSAPSLDRAFRPPGRWWVPLF